MGRDMSVVCTNEASQNPLVRAIINSDAKINIGAENIKYSLKPHKVLIFDAATEERIRF